MAKAHPAVEFPVYDGEVFPESAENPLLLEPRLTLLARLREPVQSAPPGTAVQARDQPTSCKSLEHEAASVQGDSRVL